jgi:TonB family protein
MCRMSLSSRGAWLLGAACLCLLSARAGAQVIVNGQRMGGPPNDAPLLDSIRARPEEIGGYLAVSNLYYSTRRYDDAERFLMGALTLVRKRGAAVRAPVPATGFVVSPARVGVDVTPPPKLREVRPDYPAAALEARVGGSVGVEIVVDERGRVSDARVSRSIAGLDEAALAAVRQWEFLPTVVNGRAVAVAMPVRLTFIPEPVLTVPLDARRQLPNALAVVRRCFDRGAFKEAELMLESVILAVQKERDEPRADMARSITTGRTASVWPLRAGRDLTPPARTKDVRPVYPAEARGLGGLVTFEFLIDEAGKVTSLGTVGSPEPALEQPARQAVQQWEFTPTLLAGQPIPISMGLTFNFSAERAAVDEVVRVGNDIQPPRKIKNVPPVYPREALSNRQSGLVVMEAIIDPRGKVGDVRVLRGMGDALDRAAMAAVRQWEFSPTLIGEMPISVVMTVTVSFNVR